MRFAQLEVQVGAAELVLEHYPFLRRNRRRVVSAGEITEVIPGWCPPCVRTVEGEFVFVQAPRKTELIAFAQRCGRPCVQRVDVWSSILDPFLDTERDAEDRDRVLQSLADNGVPAEEVRRMRRLVRRRMHPLTLATWEWGHYGLYDVLEAMRVATWLTGWSFSRFYWYAMELADRGSVTPPRRKKAH